MRRISYRLKYEFELAMVNKSSVLKLLRFDSIEKRKKCQKHVTQASKPSDKGLIMYSGTSIIQSPRDQTVLFELLRL